MCRISGSWQQNSQDTSIDFYQLAVEMRDCLAYGGPDHAGLYENKAQQLYLGHRRLSILDLSPAGNQPYNWQQYHLAFNGEIYNFQEIKELLSEYTFQSNSDTEVILKAWHKWGIDCLQHFRGMFAFALYDEDENQLYLVRDRLGVKPLYYYFKDGLLLFASEMKSMFQYKQLDKTIDSDSLSLYLQQGYIPSPNSILKHVKKVQPGHVLCINESGDVKDVTYWQAEDHYDKQEDLPTNQAEWKERLEEELIQSFRYRMVADVPVGSFLSGGIDSSLVSAMIQKHSNKQLKTFTIGFHHEHYNEAGFAKEIANHIGSDHNELYVTEQDFEELLPQLPVLLDEPMGDTSIIPTHIVSKLAKEQVKVSLSADGGDEFFGGYTKYEITGNVYPKVQALPKLVKSGLQKAISTTKPHRIEKISKHVPVLKNYKNFGPKLLKFKNALSADNIVEFFNLSSTFITPEEAMKMTGFAPERINFQLPKIDDNRLFSFLGLIDVKTYLEGDILTKVDRATMHTALEGREPMLDHKLFELAMQMPDELKIQGNTTKYLLREILFDYVPKELIERPKQGFAIPIEDWLKGNLKSTILSLPTNSQYVDYFQLNADELEQAISNFYNQNLNPQLIWFFYILYAWYEHWIKN